MKYNIFMALAISFALLTTSCTKESDQNQNPDNSSTGDYLVGTWNTTNNSVAWIYFYTYEGELLDSVDAPFDPSHFTFTANGKAATPWNMTYDYLVRNDSLVLSYPNFPDRCYALDSINYNKVCLDLTTIDSSYFLNQETPVVGVQVEHWELTR